MQLSGPYGIIGTMISRYSYRDLIWIDLESPSREEVLHLSEEFNIPALVCEEMLDNTMRAKVDLYDNLMFLVLHFPILNSNQKDHYQREIDFVIGKNFIITVRYELIDPLNEFAKIFEVNSILDREKITTHGGYIFMQMMKHMYDNCLNELEAMTPVIRKIEHHTFSEQEELMVRKISEASRKLLDFKQAIRFHHDVLHSYEATSKRFFGEDYSYFSSLITSEFNKVYNLLESHHETLNELQKTNTALLSTRSNTTMRTFTVMSFITFPLMLIASVFSMRASENVMFIQNYRDFFLVIAAMSLTAIVMLLFFKFKKWI